MEISKMNRRGFVGAVGLAAAGVATGTLLPNVAPPHAMLAYPKTATLTDWWIDDMTGAAPR